ncbi:thermonuclease family protein [Mycoplasmopsis felifaucium]|uniref:Thermonuclease family protein n=1 Tax=Mycoplasmopsis felifaucium TaxID=35768 RepID=A0ABZ2RS23_9BACT
MKFKLLFNHIIPLSFFSYVAVSCTNTAKEIEKNTSENSSINSSSSSADLHLSVGDFPADERFLEKYPLTNKLELNKAMKVDIVWYNDGDTFRTSNNYVFRFAGIDTPETHQRNLEGQFVDTKGDQLKYGKIAEEFTKAYSDVYRYNSPQKNKGVSFYPTEVYVVPQKTKGGNNSRNPEVPAYMCDPYTRIVSIIYFKANNGKYYNLNALIAWNGISRVHYISDKKTSKYYTDNTEYYNFLQECSEHAKQNKLGIYAPDADYSKIYP